MSDALINAECARLERMRLRAPIVWALYEQALVVLVEPYAPGGQARQEALDAITFRLGEMAMAGEELAADEQARVSAALSAAGRGR